MVLRALRERGGIVGAIVSAIGGIAWNLATFLVVPVLVIEGVGPIEAVKRSAGLLKRTWGEQVVGNLSIGLIFGLLTILVIIAGIPLVLLAVAAESVALVVVVVVVLILVVIGINLIASTLNGIYVAAVYHFVAAEGSPETATQYFSQEMLRGAFRPK
jgi:cobalamin biosynthesis protein CobD/CbiB